MTEVTIGRLIDDTMVAMGTAAKKYAEEIKRLGYEKARAEGLLKHCEEEMVRAQAFYELYYGKPYDGWWS